jgi:hypothetical protein
MEPLDSITAVHKDSPYRLRMIIYKQKKVFDTGVKLDNDNY